MDTLTELENSPVALACADRCKCGRDANLAWQINVGEYF
jgi:hypothetical protein